jgi:Zn-dependent peptidase ImmA (M78 family)
MTNEMLPKYGSAKSLLDDLRSNGFSNKLPIDIDQIASLLDIDVIYSDANASGAVGQIVIDNNGKAIITINPSENTFEPRRRFTLAHEIAHYCLHLNKQKKFIDTKKSMSRSDSYWDVYESEANTFAAQLLMPKDQIIAKGKEIADTFKASSLFNKMPASFFVDSMANYFNVSAPAMEYRLKNIGILP